MEKNVTGKGYLIGDVAQMVGLSRDALRFYEKKGIIEATKGENGYRYYSEADIYRLMYILYQRKMNISIEEIGDLMSGQNSFSARKDQIRQRLEEEEEAIRCHRQAIMRLELARQDMERLEQFLNTCSLRLFPKAYIMDTCQDLQEGLREWFRLSSETAGLDMSYFYNVLVWDGEDLRQEGTQLLFYEGLESVLGGKFDKKRYPITEEGQCIYAVFLSEDTLPTDQMICQMEQWGKAHGYEATGRIYANDMASFFEKEKTNYALEIYMPIKGAVHE